MTDPTGPGRDEELDRVGEAVAALLADLRRYEATYAAVLNPSPRAAVPNRDNTGDAAGWAARLAAAKAGADAAERLLARSEGEWTRWRAAVAGCGAVVEQHLTGKPEADNGGHRGNPAGGGAGESVRGPAEEAVR